MFHEHTSGVNQSGGLHTLAELRLGIFDARFVDLAQSPFLARLQALALAHFHWSGELADPLRRLVAAAPVRVVLASVVHHF
jgi:hypothetical protein